MKHTSRLMEMKFYKFRIFIALFIICGIFYITFRRIENRGSVYSVLGNLLPSQPYLQIYSMKSSVNEDAVRYKIKDTAKDRLLIYNMIPKTGSEAFRAVMKELRVKLDYSTYEGNYSIFPYHITTVHHTFEVLQDVVTQEILSFNWNRKRHIYHKHIHFIDFEYLFGMKTPNYLNIVRDPLDHYISWFYYRRFHKWGGLLGPLDVYERNHTIFIQSEEGRRLQNITFDECVQSDMEECLNPINMFRVLPFFCGHHDSCLKPTKSTLIKAMNNVVHHYPVVGYTENLPQFYKLIECIWPQFFLGSLDTFYSVKKNKTLSNVSKWRGGALEPNNVTKAIMKKRMAMDYEFYNWIKQRFHAMYRYYVNKVKK